jgi:hypothetical protein
LFPEHPFYPQKEKKKQDENIRITFSRRAAVSAFASRRASLCTCLAGMVIILGLFDRHQQYSSAMHDL